MKVLLLFSLAIASRTSTSLPESSIFEQSTAHFIANLENGKTQVIHEDTVFQSNPSTFVDALGNLFVAPEQLYYIYSAPGAPSPLQMNPSVAFYSGEIVETTTHANPRQASSPFTFIPGIHTNTWPQMPSLGVPTLGQPSASRPQVPATFNPTWSTQQPPPMESSPSSPSPQPQPTLSTPSNPQPHPGRGEGHDEGHEKEHHAHPSKPQHETEEHEEKHSSERNLPPRARGHETEESHII